MASINDTDKMKAFTNLVDNDLSTDHLQMIFQYYHADRADKKQDYTPGNLALFLSRLAGKSKETIDLCAGTGALTIKRWTEQPDSTFTLYEIDENVIPFLLFNMAIRNISATVHQGDVLQREIKNTWHIKKGEHFGKVTNLKPAI